MEVSAFDTFAPPSAIVYTMRFAGASLPHQAADTQKAKDLLANSIQIRDVKIVDLATQFNKRQEVERATAGRKHYPIIYINDSLIGDLRDLQDLVASKTASSSHARSTSVSSQPTSGDSTPHGGSRRNSLISDRAAAPHGGLTEYFDALESPRDAESLLESDDERQHRAQPQPRRKSSLSPPPAEISLKTSEDEIYAKLQRHLQLEDQKNAQQEAQQRHSRRSRRGSNPNVVTVKHGSNSVGLDEIEFVDADLDDDASLGASPPNAVTSRSPPDVPHRRISSSSSSPQSASQSPAHVDGYHSPLLGASPPSVPSATPPSRPSAPTMSPSPNPAIAPNPNLNLFDKTLDQLEKQSRALINWWFGPTDAHSTSGTVDPALGDAIVFNVVQSNWYNRKQERILRLEKSYIVRIHPDTSEVRSKKPYKDLVRVEKQASDSFVLIFTDGTKDYYSRQNAKEIVDTIIAIARQYKHNVTVVEMD